jgi:GH24 family phage-related lysozyme (muramidase)
MVDVMQYVWPAAVLVIFLGMLALSWRALSIAHDLAKIVIQAGLRPLALQPIPPSLPTAPPVPVPAPTVDLGAVDQALVDFIKKEEGFKANAYWDFKQWSIGYGTKATSSTEVITQAEGEIRLRTEIAKADKLVTDKFPNLPKGQHQALIDLTYNAGPGWENASLGAAVKEQKIDTIKADILQYNHAGGQVNAGLTARREAEVKMIDSPL